MKLPKITPLHEKTASTAGSFSGAASVLGSWQICHNICLGIITLLALIGISLSTMPLLFLTRIALPLWLIAISLLAVSFYFYIKKHCISSYHLLLHSGLVIAGMPFKILDIYLPLLQSFGIALAITGIILYLKHMLTDNQLTWRSRALRTSLSIMAIGALSFIVVTSLFPAPPNSITTPISANPPISLQIPPPSPNAISPRLDTKSTGSTDTGDVQIELTPHPVADGKLLVDISINTHSVSISQYNFKDITTLSFNKQQITPLEAPVPTGHHFSGTLIFSVPDNIKDYTITIDGIPDKDNHRTYQWNT